jgi:hypothetical protein
MPVPSEQRLIALESQLASREAELTQARETITKLEKAAGETSVRLNEMESGLKKTVAGYTALVLQSYPEILPELITGDTMEALDTSLSRAKNLTDKIRDNLKSQISNVRVPAGAPARGPEDLSGLSSGEKIKRGLERKS